MAAYENWTVGPVKAGKGLVQGPYCVIGLAKEERVRLSPRSEPDITLLGDDIVLGANVIVHEGCVVSSRCFIDDRARLGYGCSVGEGVRIEYGATVCDRVQIGSGSVIAGFICDAARIGAHCVVMGTLVHELSTPMSSEWGVEEAAPSVSDDVVVGMGAIIVGGVQLGARSYIAAGAIVTRNVPPDTIVINVNRMIPRANWRGKRLERISRYPGAPTTL